MRIYVEYEKGFIGFMIFYCIAIIGIVIGVWRLMPYAIQSISAHNEEFFAAVYNFGGWLNWIERGISLIMCVYICCWLQFLLDFPILGFAFPIWVIYRIMIVIAKAFMKNHIPNLLGFWIIIGVEIIAFLVPFIVTVIVWRKGRKKAIDNYESEIKAYWW